MACSAHSFEAQTADVAFETAVGLMNRFCDIAGLTSRVVLTHTPHMGYGLAAESPIKMGDVMLQVL